MEMKTIHYESQLFSSGALIGPQYHQSRLLAQTTRLLDSNSYVTTEEHFLKTTELGTFP